MVDETNVQETTPEEMSPEPDMSVEEEVEAGEEVELSRFKRLFTILSAPGAAIRGIHANGGWIFPFLGLVVSILIWVFLAGPYMAAEQMDVARDQMQERVAQGQMTQEQADRAMEVSAQFQAGMGGRIMQVVGVLIMVFLISLVNAALFLLIANVIHNGSESFGKYWSLTWYMMVPGFINFILMGILIMVTQDAHGGYLGLAILTKSDPTSALHQAANAVNIFSIWEAIIAGIGLSMFGKIGRGLGLVWGFVVVLGIPALLAFVLTGAFG